MFDRNARTPFFRASRRGCRGCRVFAFRPPGVVRRPRSFMLMEIMVALGLLLLGMSYLGAQANQGYIASRESEFYYRGVMLAQAKIAEIDTGQIYIESSAYSAMDPDADGERMRNVWEVSIEEDLEGVFGRTYPQYGWKLRIEPAADENILFFELKILYDHSRITPDAHEFEFDEVRPIYIVRFLRIIPKPLDFTTDFGMSEEEADDLADQIADSGVDLDPRNFDPSVLRDLPMEDLIVILPSILPALGMSVDDLAGMLPQEYLDMLNEAMDDGSDEGDENGDNAGSGGGQNQDDNSGDQGDQYNDGSDDGSGNSNDGTADDGTDDSGENDGGAGRPRPGRPGRN